jgi:hypothetical protein
MPTFARREPFDFLSRSVQTSAPCELDGELTLRGYGSADGFAPLAAVLDNAPALADS